MVDEYRTAGFLVQIRFDPWSGPIGLDPTDPSASQCTTVIGGRGVQINTLWRNEHTIHASWPRLAPDPFGHLHLAITIRASDFRRYDEMIGVLRSVRFKNLPEGD